MKNNSKLKQVLLVCNRTDELLRLVGATFGFSQKNEEEKFDNSEKIFMAGLFTLRVFARNLLTGNRRRNIFFVHISF